MRHVERAVEDDVRDRVEAVRGEVLGRADEVAGRVVDEAGERPRFVPDPLHHRVDRRGIADVDRMGPYVSAEFLCGGLKDGAAAPGNPQLRAELDVARGDLLAKAGAAASDEDPLTFEQAFLEHGRSAREAPILTRPMPSSRARFPGRRKPIPSRTTSSPWRLRPD